MDQEQKINETADGDNQQRGYYRGYFPPIYPGFYKANERECYILADNSEDAEKKLRFKSLAYLDKLKARIADSSAFCYAVHSDEHKSLKNYLYYLDFDSRYSKVQFVGFPECIVA